MIPSYTASDAFARPLFALMSKNVGKQFIIDNKGGAGGNLGAGIAAKAAPDGYTMFMGAVHYAIAPSMYPKLDYSIETDFIPVGLISSVRMPKRNSIESWLWPDSPRLVSTAFAVMRSV